MSERKAVGELYVGIDVSKSWLDVHVLPSEESRRVANSGPGHRLPARRLGKRMVLIALEATGKWHRPLHRAFAKPAASRLPSPIPTARGNSPNRSARPPSLSPRRRGTDRVDARVPAVYAMAIKPDAASR